MFAPDFEALTLPLLLSRGFLHSEALASKLALLMQLARDSLPIQAHYTFTFASAHGS